MITVPLTNVAIMLTGLFDEATGTLTISGTGDMYDYDLYAYEETPAPWFMRSGTYSTEGIKHVVIQDGITHIGDCSLFGTAIESVKLPEISEKHRTVGFS